MKSRKQSVIAEMKLTIEQVKEFLTYSNKILALLLKELNVSPYEVIGHLVVFDRFLLKERIPQVLLNRTLSESINLTQFEAATTMEIRQYPPAEVLIYFIKVRKMLITQIQYISDENWTKEYVINGEKETLEVYIEQFIAIEKYYFNEIQLFLETLEL